MSLCFVKLRVLVQQAKGVQTDATSSQQALLEASCPPLPRQGISPKYSSMKRRPCSGIEVYWVCSGKDSRIKWADRFAYRRWWDSRFHCQRLQRKTTPDLRNYRWFGNYGSATSKILYLVWLGLTDSLSGYQRHSLVRLWHHFNRCNVCKQPCRGICETTIMQNFKQDVLYIIYIYIYICMAGLHIVLPNLIGSTMMPDVIHKSRMWFVAKPWSLLTWFCE